MSQVETKISKADFCQKIYLAILAETTFEDIEIKKEKSLLVHDLGLDLDLFGDMIIYNMDLSGLPKLDISPLFEFLPVRHGLIDMLFCNVRKKYGARYEPITIEKAASMIYDSSFK